MENKEQITSKEAEQIKGILSEVAQKNHLNLSLNQLIHKWRSFITKIERCYDDSIYEYTNDLSIRDIIEEVLQQVPRDTYAKLMSEIKELDEKFYEVTIEKESSLAKNSSKEGRWWFRVPKKMSSELKDDLRSEFGW